MFGRPDSPVNALQSLGLISDEQYNTHCNLILTALHDCPTEMPLWPNAANATNVANAALPKASSFSKSQRLIANAMAYMDRYPAWWACRLQCHMHLASHRSCQAGPQIEELE